MNRTRRRLLAGSLAAAATLSLATTWWLQRDPHQYLTGDTADFVALFPDPPAPDSPETRLELDELLALQRARSEADVAAARADKKTEIERFNTALGLDPGASAPPKLRALAQAVEDDIRPYVRAVKDKYRRLRPYEIDPALEPCIDDVRGDLSYPSGHATYGYVMAYLLWAMLPDRRELLLERAREFGRQRMICGVHFRSDVEAGETGARWLIERLQENPDYRRDAMAAAVELRTVLGLRQQASNQMWPANGRRLR